MRQAAAWLLCLGVLLAACGAKSEKVVQPLTGVVVDGEFQYAPLGWSMSVPWRWRVLSPEQLQATLGKGQALMEKATGSEVIDTEIHLLYLRMNQRNQFTSSLSPHDPSLGSEPEQVAATFDFFLQAYQALNLPVKGTRSSEIVDGISFDVLQISMRDRNGRGEAAQQDVYMARVGPDWLTVSITTADWLPRQQIRHAWRGSKFSKKRDSQ